MSKIRTAALGAVLTFGLAAFAGAQVTAKPDSAGRGMRDGGPRRGMMQGQRHRGMKGRHGGAGRSQGQGRLMSDLKLTDAQKTRVKSIHEKYQPQYKTLREQGKTQFESLRGARQKGDTSAAARQRSMAIRTQEQNELRGILTAEQRTKWDARAAQRKQRMVGRQEKMKQRRGDRARTKA